MEELRLSDNRHADAITSLKIDISPGGCGVATATVMVVVMAVNHSQCVTKLSYLVALWAEGSFFSAAVRQVSRWVKAGRSRAG